MLADLVVILHFAFVLFVIFGGLLVLRWPRLVYVHLPVALYGALMLGEADAAVRRKALSATKIEIDRTARRVGQEAVQLHGAMGVTEELAVGHYFKRLSMIGVTFGDTSWHLRRHASA